MLELQRASAGSGKTYALAKKFIWYYITIPEEGAGRRLRTDAELSESLSHILAVTFTNKATNEMQQRIVEKLYALGYPEANGKKPDYMQDFLDDLQQYDPGVSEERISAVCRRAVGIMLNNYSDFHVSTIDSFFQQVLRTFAYESDLSNSYRIEIDADVLSRMAIDGLLEDINSDRDKTGASFWVSELMNRAKAEGKKWNIFAKSSSDQSIYSLLVSSVKQLENEEFKMVRRYLDSYFNSGVDFVEVYRSLYDKYEFPVIKAYRKLLSAIKGLKDELSRSGDRLEATDRKTFRNRINKVEGTKYYQLATISGRELTEYPLNPAATYTKRKTKGDTAAYDLLEAADENMSAAYEEWASMVKNRNFRHWWLYRSHFPFMGLLQAIREKRDEYLRENNAIELGETNAMLHDIIGEEDAPFIYERIGTRLNHFLIDEFQDTSKMQWQNISPLLHESLGRGNDNLIIGDAKQSIYRFRNADSSLISSKVEDEFGAIVKASLPDRTNNTNWRSDLRIVQFNNSFFDFLTLELNNKVGSEASEMRRDFRKDYENVVQYPRHQEEKGYVEVHLGEPGDKEFEEKKIADVIDIINDARSRGYRLRDIAVLVRTQAEASEIIEAITAYNGLLPEGEEKIEYVGEQSLKLSSSAAVSMVVAVLETIARGAKPEVREGEEKKKRGVADWSQIACNFRFFALRHPELSTPECLDKFLEKGADNNAISEMLGKMQSVILPSLVESIIAEFLPEDKDGVDIRKRDAVFLAAFQDMVLEYCESHPGDLASFLQYWNEKKGGASIASPEDMNAVTVMTVHKSKGLEFPIVILPYSNVFFHDKEETNKGRQEWRWRQPVLEGTEAGDLPPFIPLPVSSALTDTEHEPLLTTYYDQKKMDDLNTIYVAFTRAGHELYIFSSSKGVKGKDNLPTSLMNLLRLFFESLSAPESGDVSRAIPEAIGGDGQTLFTYGDKTEKYMPKEDKGDYTEVEISDYIVRPTPDFLSYIVKDAPDVVDADDPELSEDIDPRSEGNILHEIMSEVKRREDIPRAVRRRVINGELTKEEGSQYTALLTAKTMEPAVRGWYEGKWEVLNERPLLCAERKEKRPDRVMISPEGDAVVLDYKFGESLATGKRYARQVHDYVERLKDTGRYRSVKGYLWYVKLNKVELVAN